ncbi:MAG TPA: DUF3131 domain-containing protein [Longimicrobiales bacterium]
MRRITAAAAGIVVIGGVAFLAIPSSPGYRGGGSGGDASSITWDPGVLEESVSRLPRPPLTAAESAFYRDAAAAAWKYLDANYQSRTGLVNGSPEWHYTTTWDIGAQLLAFLAARDVGLISTADYRQRVLKTLGTMERAQLYDRAAYNKTYSTTTGSAGDGQRGATGWSATDLGRLLIAAKVVATRDPDLAPAVERVVKRIDMSQVVKDGYLHGRMVGSSGKPWTFQEGRIGYEQYAAHGFALWNANVGNAAAVATNASPMDVMGVNLPRDRRGLDRLNSEPFILMGLEVGLTPDMRALAEKVLQVQQARYEKTGTLTVVSEDAVAVAPHYFYYYCIIANGKPFMIDLVTPGKSLDSPRWVSTKAALGWHALMPNAYTRLAVDHVTRTRTDAGWASGVYEDTGKSTGTLDINTSAVVLEAAAYQLRGGKPLIEG